MKIASEVPTLLVCNKPHACMALCNFQHNNYFRFQWVQAILQPHSLTNHQKNYTWDVLWKKTWHFRVYSYTPFNLHTWQCIILYISLWSPCPARQVFRMASLAVTWMLSLNLWCTKSQRSGQDYRTVLPRKVYYSSQVSRVQWRSQSPGTPELR